jgi:hypothetical protein
MNLSYIVKKINIVLNQYGYRFINLYRKSYNLYLGIQSVHSSNYYLINIGTLTTASTSSLTRFKKNINYIKCDPFFLYPSSTQTIASLGYDIQDRINVQVIDNDDLSLYKMSI